MTKLINKTKKERKKRKTMKVICTKCRKHGQGVKNLNKQIKQRQLETKTKVQNSKESFIRVRVYKKESVES